VDRTGANGYDPGDYAGQSSDSTGFGGTSSATPLASGVAALVLSQSPGLTAVQLRQAIRYGTDRIGGAAATYENTYPPVFPMPAVPGVNTEYGFGRLNALKALNAATAPRIAAYRGSSSVTNGGSFSLSGYVGTTTFHTLELRNESIHTLNLASAQISPGVVALALPTFSTTSVGPGITALLTLRFAPTTGGSDTQTLTFETNDPDQPTFTATILSTATPISGYGRVFLDLDGDHLPSPFETGLAHRLTFIDADLNGSPATTGWISSVDVPKNIPDSNATGVESSILVGSAGTVGTVRVRVNLTHTYTSDLELRLVAPNGTLIPLANNRGGSGDNFASTEFRDDTANPISSGSAPFTGLFRPESPLTNPRRNPRCRHLEAPRDRPLFR
jgi:large repetitive protein